MVDSGFALKGATVRVKERGSQAKEAMGNDNLGRLAVLGYYGWFWFMYGDYAGPVHFIDHINNRFFPEDFYLCTGYGYQANKGVKIDIEKVWSSGVQANGQKILGELVDVIAGGVAGATQVGPPGLVGAAPQHKKVAVNKKFLLRGGVRFDIDSKFIK